MNTVMTTGDGLRIELDEHNAIALAVHDQPAPFASGLRVQFAGDWRRSGGERLVDELEERWQLGQVEAIVRHVFGESPLWSLRVQLVNRGDQPASVPACWLAVDAAWPPRAWLAGAEGQLSLDPAAPGIGLATLTQLRGRCRLSDGRYWLTDLPVRLAPAGDSGSQYQVAWRLDVLADERVQAAALPTWWPATTSLQTGDVVALDLPDAAIEGAGLQLLEDEQGTTISGQCGVHIAQVHTGRGTTDLELAFADPLPQVLGQAAEEVVSSVDPRVADAAECFLVARLASTTTGAPEWLATAVDELLHRTSPLEPLALAAIAEAALERPELAVRLPDALARTREAPGVGLARLRSLMALQLSDQPTHVPSGVASESTPLEAELMRLEHQLITGAVRTADHLDPAQWRLLGLLGAGLPGHTADPVSRAQLVAITSLAPEGIDLAARWPIPLADARERCLRRLVAERHGPDVLAWLAV